MYQYIPYNKEQVYDQAFTIDEVGAKIHKIVK